MEIDGQIDGQVDSQIDGQIDGQIGGQVDDQIDGQIDWPSTWWWIVDWYQNRFSEGLESERPCDFRRAANLFNGRRTPRSVVLWDMFGNTDNELL